MEIENKYTEEKYGGGILIANIWKERELIGKVYYEAYLRTMHGVDVKEKDKKRKYTKSKKVKRGEFADVKSKIISKTIKLIRKNKLKMKTQSKLEVKYSKATGKPTSYTNGYTQGYTAEYKEWLESIVDNCFTRNDMIDFATKIYKDIVDSSGHEPTEKELNEWLEQNESNRNMPCCVFDISTTYHNGDECMFDNVKYKFMPTQRQEQFITGIFPDELTHGWGYAT
jgi:hypothetical protein